LSPDGQVTRRDLAIVYNADSAATGRPPLSAKAFCAAVRRLRPTVKDSQRMIDGTMKDVFLGLALCRPSSAGASPAVDHRARSLFTEEVVHDDH